MRSTKTELVLTLTSVLLAGLVIGKLSGSPIGSNVAGAAEPQLAPNAAVQRQKMVQALAQMNKRMEEMNKNLMASTETQRRLLRLLERGNVRVIVTNLDEVDIQIDDRR